MPLFRLITISYCLLMSSQAYAAEIINISSYEYPPEQSQTLPHHGGVLHIVEEAFASEGVQIKWHWFPNQRALKMAQAGKVDALATMGLSEERAKVMHVSDSVISAHTRFYHLKTLEFSWQSMTDLKGMKVGVTGHYNYGDEFNQAREANIFTVDVAHNDELNFKKLLVGRTQVFPMTTGIAEYIILNKMGPEALAKVTYHEKPVRSFDSYVYFTKKNDKSLHYLEIFNQGLKKIRENGKYDEIITAYERGDYSKPAQ